MRIQEASDTAAAETAPPPAKRARREKIELGLYGNYTNYYAKRGRPGQGDARLNFLKKDWIQGKKVLDVGCNAGHMTIEIAQTMQPYRIIGVDIDPDLVRAANKQVRLEWSLMKPMPALQEAARALDRRKQADTAPRSGDPYGISRHHFPLSMPRMFGFLPMPPADLMRPLEELDEEKERERARPGGRGKVMPRELRIFPENIKFKATDWLNEDIDTDKRGYDLILALSISKWIHLNEGDKGIRDFFAKVYECLRPNGHFVLEPQPWSSYAKAKRLDDELRATCAGLELRPEAFASILSDEIGFKTVETLGQAGEGGFARPLLVCTKSGGSWV